MYRWHYTAWSDLQTFRQNLNLSTIGAEVVGMENVRADLASSIDVFGKCCIAAILNSAEVRMVSCQPRGFFYPFW